MTSSRRSLGPLVVLFAIAAIAWFAAGRLPTLVHEYQQAHEFSPAWGYAYLAILATAVLSTAVLALWALWLLVGAGRAKIAAACRAEPAAQPDVADRSTGRNRVAPGRRAAAWPTIQRCRSKRGPRCTGRSTICRPSASAKNWRSWPLAPFRAASRRCSTRWPAATSFAAMPPAARRSRRSELSWPGADHVVLVDTPGLAEVKGLDREIPARQAARDADLVLFVVDGPLKQFEFALLREPGRHGKASDRLPEQRRLVYRCRSSPVWSNNCTSRRAR